MSEVSFHSDTSILSKEKEKTDMKQTTKNMLIAFILNLSFAIIELIGGIVTNSISIISDSVHDLGDSLSIGVSLALEKKSERKPDEKYTYGYLRYSLIGALVSSVVLICGSVFVIYNSVTRIMTPSEVNYDGMLVLAILGVIINGIAALRTSRGSNLNEKSISLHMLEDVLGWGAILIGSVVIRFTGLHILDPIMSLAITVYVLIHAITNIKGVFDILLEKAPEGKNVKEISEELVKLSGVKDIHHIHIWTLDGVNSYITLHAVIEESSDIEKFGEIKHEIRHTLEHFGISHSTIEIEYKKCEADHCEPTTEIRSGCHHHHHDHGHSHAH